MRPASVGGFATPSPRLRLRHYATIILIAGPATTWAQAVFLQPASNALTALGATQEYNAGEDVRIAWASNFASTNLRVWQAAGDGTLFGETLASNYTSDQTSFTWPAKNVVSASDAGPLHFELSDGSGSCEADCSTDSTDFSVAQTLQSTSSSATSSTSSSSASSAATAASTTSASSSATQTTTSASSSDVGAATASSDSANNGVSGTQDRHHNNDLAIGLGVGLGIGLPLLALLLALCFCFRRRHKRNAEKMPRGQHPTISRPMQQQRLRDSDQQPIMPTIPAPVMFPDHQSHRHSGTTVNSVAESYHGPFEFEGQGGRDFDTKSVISEYDQRSGRWGTPTGRRSASGSTRTATPNNHGRSRLRSIDEQMPPRMVTPPQWPLRS